MSYRYRVGSNCGLLSQEPAGSHGNVVATFRQYAHAESFAHTQQDGLNFVYVFDDENKGACVLILGPQS